MPAQTQVSAVPVQRQSLVASLPVVTLLLIAVNVGLYLWQIAHGVNATEPDANDLVRWGANVSAYTLTGEFWRLPASMFLHIGAAHLLLNMISLLFLGTLVERNFGKIDFIVIYVLAGLGGGMVSAIWNSTEHGFGLAAYMFHGPRIIISAGASGALMGLASAAVMLRVVAMGRDQRLPYAFSGRSIAALIFINILYGWKSGGTDNACHVGGIIAGALIGLALAGMQTSRPLARRAGAAFLLAGGVAASLVVLRQYTADQDLQALHQELVEQAQAEAAEQAQQARVQAAAEALHQQRARVAEVAAQDAKRLPAPVGAKQAAGTRIKLGGGAMNFALSADGRHAYVTDNDANTLSVVDVVSKTIVRTIAGGRFPKVGNCPSNMCAGRGAAGVAVSADEKYAYVTSIRQNAVAVVDLATGKIARTIAVGTFPTDILLSPDDKTAYVMNAVDNSVSVVDLAAGSATQLKLSETDASGQPFGHPTDLALSPDGKTLYVTNSMDSTVVAIDTATRRPLRSAEIEGGPFDLDLSSDGKLLSVLSAGGVTQLDAATLKPRDDLILCDNQPRYAFSLSPDGKRAAVAEMDQDQIRIVKLDTRRTLGLYPAGDGPIQVAFVPGSSTVLALSHDTLSILDEKQRMDTPTRGPDDADAGQGDAQSTADDAAQAENAAIAAEDTSIQPFCWPDPEWSQRNLQ
jgi:YVTN family beta-propeller protein